MDQGERFNSISHLIGTCLALAGGAILVVRASIQGDPWKIISFSIYGVTLVALYFFSTIYHGTSGRRKAFFQKLDHAAIYVLIAGTYTPFTLVTLRGAWGWPLFAVIWSLALIGLVQDLVWKSRRRILSVVIYVLMGWLALSAVRPLTHALSSKGMFWMLAGGVFYTVGVLFYALDKKLPHSHPIFHLFVLAGSVSHYITILLFVA
jgi:hemolysin III